MSVDNVLALLRRCALCPRECGADRFFGERGFCGAVGEDALVARAAPHYWEEPCLSGSQGSGTVFFSYCPLGCVYCQNRAISRGGAGEPLSIPRLAETFLGLQGMGVHNLNLVTPTHYVPQIIAALRQAKAAGLTLPVVFNCGGYEKPETLRLLEGLVDVWLPDFKYFLPETAARYSAAADYPERAKAALAEMVRQAGPPVFNEEGMLTRGVIVRHLVLPGLGLESKKILRYLHKTYGNQIYISIMSQFTPLENVADYPEINRKVAPEEYGGILHFAEAIGIENAFIQEGDPADESFIPSF